MKDRTIYLADTPLHRSAGNVAGDLVRIEDEEFLRIEDVHLMRPFFMSLVSHSDHWMFVSSTGGMSAGRRNADAALFPYYTDDKITSGAGHTGGVTVMHVEKDSRSYLWEPFSDRYAGAYQIRRNLYKSVLGNQLIFEEINQDLGLAWQGSWQVTEQFGFVRTSHITNTSGQSRTVEFLDGVQNILPYGLSEDLQNKRSNLANAYKRSELDTGTNLGIFSLSSMIVDRAEPSEALRATIAWCTGVTPNAILLSSRQLDQFRQGSEVRTETDVKAEPGAYLVNSLVTLAPGGSRKWWIAADVEIDHTAIASMMKKLQHPDQLASDLMEDIRSGSDELRTLVATADGLQCSADRVTTARHFANVLFNIMRGGIFEDQYQVEKGDLLEHLQSSNREVYKETTPFLGQLPARITYQDLLQRVIDHGYADLVRLTCEYLPLSFSRRHGDPSRPWNKFSIEGKDSAGKRRKYYQGNWRDIFQNWEALALSFPGYIPSMMAKFVNASTRDGYNPYRITRDGIDWEVIEPDDPWSYIGYWGDHQIIYLLKLLEIGVAHHPELIHQFFSARYFAFADVPYRIRGYEQIVADPRDTIDFDHELATVIQNRVSLRGADGKLVHDRDGALLRVTLAEKLLLALLVKVSNFVPDAGIWLNTQRPEWNDANNALVGNGVSMVTLYYLYRYVAFIRPLFSRLDTWQLTEPVAKFLEHTIAILNEHEHMIDRGFDDQARMVLVEALGRNGEAYRDAVYGTTDGDTTQVDTSSADALFDLLLRYFSASIAHNKRKDGLYHAYNLIRFDDNGLAIDHLYEMLEGQVAVLSAGILKPEESLDLLDQLKRSTMYRADQASYMLYPNRDLPGFLQKNVVPVEFAERSLLVRHMLTAGDTSIITRDIFGTYHFNGDFHNAKDLQDALNAARERYPDLVAAEEDQFLQTFEEIFDHSSFTGRSGTFYGYEGLGSIYWHMVSKLLVAVQENIRWAPPDHQAVPRLIDHYHEIRAGIGMHKSPEVYGAFPTDPYSHTPWAKGVQQPGMTGQVKEDILNRWAELGVAVDQGRVSFAPAILHTGEYLEGQAAFEYVDVGGVKNTIDLVSGQLAFTYCQVPVIYTQADNSGIEVQLSDGSTLMLDGTSELPEDLSKEIGMRTGKVACVKVNIV